MIVVMRRGLYYSYIITSQSYSLARLISGSNGFNELDTAAELAATVVDVAVDVVVDAVVKLVDAIIDAECYIGGDAFFYTTNYRQWLFYSKFYIRYKILFSTVIIEYFISSSFISFSFISSSFIL